MPLSAQAQQASIRGTVKDQSGALIPRASVRLTGRATRSAQSNDEGALRFEGLSVGDYTIRASGPAAGSAQALERGADDRRAGATLLGRIFGRGPGQVMMNLRLARTFSFGFGSGQEAPSNIPEGGERRADGGGVFGGLAKTNRKYNIVLSMSIRNLLNHNNPGPIVGSLASLLFGRANQAAGSPLVGGTIFSEDANNRRFELQTRFTF